MLKIEDMIGKIYNAVTQNYGNRCRINVYLVLTDPLWHEFSTITEQKHLNNWCVISRLNI